MKTYKMETTKNLRMNFRISDNLKPEQQRPSKKFYYSVESSPLSKPSDFIKKLNDKNTVLHKYLNPLRRQESEKKLKSSIFSTAYNRSLSVLESRRSCKKFEERKDNVSAIISYKDVPNMKIYVNLNY